MNISPTLVQAFAPTGVLRASINLSNPILAGLKLGAAEPHGVSVDLAREFAKRLGVPIELAAWDGPAKSVAAVSEDRADIGFFAIDPLRGASVAFTAPYVLIEGSYLVREDSPLQSTEEVDQPGRTVVVGKGSAYDLFLTRELRNATIEHTTSSAAVLQHFLDRGFDVAAGIKQVLEAEAKRRPGLRMLPGRFMEIRQAMGLPKSRGAEAAALLGQFVEDVKASGFVAEALARHGIEGASVAPCV
jgi:polar amino acid transport system substrate-binding protein